jgi:hypothetical protein
MIQRTAPALETVSATAWLFHWLEHTTSLADPQILSRNNTNIADVIVQIDVSIHVSLDI